MSKTNSENTNTKSTSVNIQLQKVADSLHHALALKFITDTHEYITFGEFCKLCDNINTTTKYSKVILSLCDILGKIPFPFYWECAPIRALTDPMHIYLVKADNFAVRKADISGFKNQITVKNEHDLALHFTSATGSSELIIPNPMKSESRAHRSSHILEILCAMVMINSVWRFGLPLHMQHNCF